MARKPAVLWQDPGEELPPSYAAAQLVELLAAPIRSDLALSEDSQLAMAANLGVPAVVIVGAQYLARYATDLKRRLDAFEALCTAYAEGAPPPEPEHESIATVIDRMVSVLAGMHSGMHAFLRTAREDAAAMDAAARSLREGRARVAGVFHHDLVIEAARPAIAAPRFRFVDDGRAA